ncbi:MAG: NADH:ubiquinone reductase (Na(+)-transporting) subunit B [Bacteroidales bacterium]|jgi:Na+-transporting NADH:ubiquinone oxidoreductase subunit B|nr:NADH:ubiquinone reductase (Na(+)-transporting) subunit B [Bacteroidales bacterium]
MKGIRNFVDKIKPNFEKGGKFSFLWSVFDGFETFLFVPNTVTKSGCHIRDAIDMKRGMITVVIALIPALLFGMYNVGYQHFLAIGEIADFWKTFFYGFLAVLPSVIISYVVGLTIEFYFAQKRRHEISEGFLVTGLLIPMILPINVPLWMIALATAFAVFVGKEIFGGTGMNIINPALLARAFLFFAYPLKMSGDDVWVRIGKHHQAIDGFSGATPLGEALNDNIAAIHDTWSISDMVLGFIPGSVGETSFVAILLGAIFLLITGIVSWKIMLSIFAGGYLMGLIFNLVGANDVMLIPAWEHFLIGGFAFGAVFMATDPVTSAQTETGKYIYGALIGILCVLMRVINPAYPEGMMLAILLMNVFAPLIDYLVVQSNIRKRVKRAKDVMVKI